MQKLILYSFRRCPYAIRARWAIKICEFKVELREIDLRNKPEHFNQISKSKTVPLLILDSKTIIEESLDIILWSLENAKNSLKEKYFNNYLKDEILEIINENDSQFKYHLDRFKYSSRYNKEEKMHHFSKAYNYITKWNKLINKKSSSNYWLIGDQETIADWSIWPFVRQFKIACKNEKILNYFEPNIKSWLYNFENHKNFKDVMYKYNVWQGSSKEDKFPIN